MSKRIAHRTVVSVSSMISIAVCASLLTGVPSVAQGATDGRPEHGKIKSVPVSKVKAKGHKNGSIPGATKLTPSQLPKKGDKVDTALGDDWSDAAGGMSLRSENSDSRDVGFSITPLGRTTQSNAAGLGPVFEVSPVTTPSDEEPKQPASSSATDKQPSASAPSSDASDSPPDPTPTPNETTDAPEESEKTDASSTPELLDAPLEVKVEYGDFANAFGGDWAGRLRLVKLDDCKTSKSGVDCSKAEPLKTKNDLKTHSLTASIPADQTQGTMMIAATAGASSAQGDYTATPMTSSSSWAAGNQSGDFNWTYPLAAPDGPGGPTPDLAISYSSGSVDGKTSATNGQTSWVGEGFSLDPGFVERSYEPCRQVEERQGVASNAALDVGDLCWRDDNLTISLNGRSSELVRVGVTAQWRMKSDDGTRIEQKTSTPIPGGDNDGEYWKVTTPDGTQYFYGLNKRFTGDTHTTKSVSTVPVYGSRANEPCHHTAFEDSVCDQGWRWGLDYVVDTHGNTMSLFYDQERQWYGANKNATGQVREYDRAALLTSIEYGTRQGDTSQAPVKVAFSTEERCIESGGFDCNSTITEANASHWPEVPFDQICTSTTNCAGRISPTFFSRKRLTKVETFVTDGSGGYDPVNEWKLTQELAPIEQEVDVRTLVLNQIQQTGKAGSVEPLPPVTFGYTQMDNRVYDGSGTSAFRRLRVDGIDNGTGGSIAVGYSEPDCTAADHPAKTDAALASNSRRCYPVWFQPDWSTGRQIEFFNKYRVESIGETDLTGNGEGKLTKYTYTGGDGWHYTSDTSMERPKYRSWNEWRGYQAVATEVGLDNKTYTQTLYMRGMHGDKTAVPSVTKNVQVTDTGLPNGADSWQDDDELAGFPRRTVTRLGESGAVVDITVNDPWVSAATATQGSEEAHIVDVAKTDTKTALSTPGTYRTTRQTTTFNGRGQPTAVLDSGDLAVATDDRCTQITYATNDTDGLFDFPATEITLAGSCAAVPASAADVISATRTYYDDGALGAAPTKGDPSKVESASGWTFGGGITYQTDATSVYDNYGRAVSEKNANGDETTAAYTPTSGLVESIVTTNPLGQTSTTTVNQLGAPKSETDIAGAKTDYKYDGLGRVTSIWAPGRDQDAGESASVKYAYRVSTTEANAVTTETLNNAGDYVTSVSFYDGFLRERGSQTQAPGVSGGRLITDKFYDDHGWVSTDRQTYWNDSPVDTTLVTGSEINVRSQSNLTYDQAGRVTTDSHVSYGDVLYSTTASFGGDRVSITPPSGGTATTTVTDARGQTTSLMQYLGATPSGTADTTTYGYTKRGELTKITDSSGTIWNKTYDIRGQLITDADPDAGTTAFTYDALGQQITSTDARAVKLWSKYDKLGRRIELRDDTATGTLRSSWLYDTIRPGALTSSTRYDGANVYKNEVTAFDDAGRPTSSQVVIPAAEGLLGGTYVTGAEYNVDGSIKNVTQPAIDDAAPEVLTYTYDALGNPKTLTGNTPIVRDTEYSELGPIWQRVLGTTTGKSVSDTRDFELDTLRTTRRWVALETTGVTPAIDLRYTYDNVGNVTKLDDLTAASTWRQCFKYDYLQRMTTAYSSSGTTCAAPTTANLGTVAPYWDAYTFAKSGNRSKVVSVRKPGAALVTTTHTSTFPAATSARPHAVTSTAKSGGSTGTESYVYDLAGNMSKRSTSTTAGKNIVFDREGHIKTVTDIATNKVTAYLYDADGNRLIERDAGDASSTLYLGSGEVKLKAGVRTTTRTYTMGGEAVATRVGTAVTLTTTDNNGTPLLSVNATTQAKEKRRYSPYGEMLQAPVSWPSNHGYLNKVADKTGTTHLDAREYDTAGSRFISVDPFMDPMDPQTMNGYAYANNSPITSSDPTGLYVPCEGKCGGNPGSPYIKGGTNSIYSVPKSGVPHLKGGLTNDHDYKGLSDAELAARERARRIAQLDASMGGGGFLGLGKVGKSLYDVFGGTFETCIRNFDRNACLMNAGIDVASALLGSVTFGSGGVLVKVTTKGLLKHEDEIADAAKLTDNVPTACMKSFSGSTVVLMSDGTRKPIEEIKVGDEVLATDPETGEQAAKHVTAVWVHQDTLTDLVVDGEVITTTEDHPFWNATDRVFEDVSKIDPGEMLLAADGRLIEVEGLALETEKVGAAYNLTVEGMHTYFVGARSVLVHNEDLEHTPATHPEEFESVRGQKAKRNKATREIWEPDMLHKNHYEVYKNKKDFDNRKRTRAVWSDGRFKGCL